MEEPQTVGVALRLLAVFVLVLANAFFVASEFALVAARQTKVDQMANQGDARARLTQRVLGSLDRYISGTQLGITIASLGLGWIGEPAVATLIEGVFHDLPGVFAPIATHAVAVAIAFAFITFLHIVLGELAPKALALLYPEDVSGWVVVPLMAFTKLMSPFIWGLNGSANLILRVFGTRPPSEAERVHQPEEIVMLVRQSQRTGSLAHQDVRMIEGVFEFTEKTVRDVMTPRTQVVALRSSTTLEDSIETVAGSGHSRFPVYDDSLDDVVGILLAKEILGNLKTNRFRPVSDFLREPMFVPGTREVEDLLADMKRTRTHMAVVLDEYGGTAGIVTMEDLLEEIVGEIRDEHDEAELAALPTDDSQVVPGKTEIDEFNARFDLELSDEDYNTVGGYVFGRLGRLPQVGDRVRVRGGTLKVVAMDGNRVSRIRVMGRKKEGEESRTGR